MFPNTYGAGAPGNATRGSGIQFEHMEKLPDLSHLIFTSKNYQGKCTMIMNSVIVDKKN